MHNANEKFAEVVRQKEDLKKQCDERIQEVDALQLEKKGLQERIRGLEISVETIVNEKDSAPPDPLPPVPVPAPAPAPAEAPPHPPTPETQQLLEKLAASEQQRADLLHQLAEEKERGVAKLQALAEEVRAEMKRLHLKQ